MTIDEVKLKERDYLKAILESIFSSGYADEIADRYDFLEEINYTDLRRAVNDASVMSLAAKHVAKE